MSKGNAPAAPDYVGAAQLQGELSKESLNMQNYANRPVQNTPWGSTTWSTKDVEDPATGQKVTQWTQNTTLPENLQKALDDQISMQSDRSGLASSFMDRVSAEYREPFDWQSLPKMAQAAEAGKLQSGITDYTRGLTSSAGPQQSVQRSLAMGDNPAMPTLNNDFRNQVANDLMAQMAPGQRMQQQSIEADLANRGLKVGTAAYQRAMDDLNQRQSAERYNALGMAGQEAQRLYSMQMGARQQAFNEDLSGGQFANQAANQAFQQNLASSQFQNQALGQAQAMDLGRMQAGNQASQQQFAMNSQQAAQQNALRQQAIAEQMQRRGMSLNEMNALLTGQQVNMPQMPNFMQAGRAETPNILGATQMGYDAALGQYNANQAGFSNLLGGLFSLGGAAMGAPGLFGFGGGR